MLTFTTLLLLAECSWQIDQSYSKKLCLIIIVDNGVYFDCLICIFFLSEFCFTNIHESQDCKGRGRAFH